MTNKCLKLMAIQAAKPKANTATVEAAAPVAEAGPAEAPTELTPAEPTATEAATQTEAEITTKTPAAVATEVPAEAAVTPAEVLAKTKAEEVAAVTAGGEAATTPAAEPSAEWTEEDDQLLMEMKANNNSWKQINDAFPGKTHIKERFKTLNKGKGKETVQGNGKKIVEGKAKESVEGNGKKSAEGKGNGKGKPAAGGSKKRQHNWVDADALLLTDEFDGEEYDSEERGPCPEIVVDKYSPNSAGEALSAREVCLSFPPTGEECLT